MTRFFSALALVSLLAVPLAPRPVSAQEEEKKGVPVPANGFEAFGNLLHHLSFHPIQDSSDLPKHSPGQTCIFVIGEAKLNELDAAAPGGLRQFLGQGGAMLVASSSPGKLRPLRIEIFDGKIRQVQRSAYRGIEDCPMIVEGVRKSTHPLFRGLSRGIASNRPAMLDSRERSLEPLAFFSDDVVLPNPWDAGPAVDQDRFPFLYASSAESPPAGRMVAFSGEGVLINGMLLANDNDNLLFTLNMLRWLREGPDQDRQFALVLIDGKPLPKFSLPLMVSVPSLPLDRILVVFNKMLAGMDAENRFNNALLERFGHTGIWRALWIGLAALLSFLMLRRFLLARFRLETWVPLLVGRKSAPPPALPLEWQRQHALNEMDNFWEPAQVAVREFFTTAAGIPVPLWGEPLGQNPPRVIVPGKRWVQWLMQRRVVWLWKVAAQPPSRSIITRRRYLKLLQMLQDFRDELESGNVQISVPRQAV